MKKKPPVLRFPKPKAVAERDGRHWHNGGDIEIRMYARSLHKAANSLIASLDLQPNPKTAWDACPVVLLYREAIELHLKVLVDQGGSFLAQRTDPLTLAKTHALRWLAQIVCQIIKAVRWEHQFKCEGVTSLSEFSALLNELEELNPVTVALRPGYRRPDSRIPDQLLPLKVVRLAKRLDALIGLLDATADALAATATLMEVGETEAGVKPTIQ